MPENKTASNLAMARLLLYTNMPARDEAWSVGFESARANSDVADNPFGLQDEEHQHWNQGWWDGFYHANSHEHEDEYSDTSGPGAHDINAQNEAVREAAAMVVQRYKDTQRKRHNLGFQISTGVHQVAPRLGIVKKIIDFYGHLALLLSVILGSAALLSLLFSD